jgi:hypothetical protein
MFTELLARVPAEVGTYLPCPPAGDRAAWTGLPERVRTRLVATGEAALGRPYAALPATAYMDFVRTGDRARFQALYFSRRRQLVDLTMAECVEGRGRFLDGIIDGVFALAEESGWQLPAHNSYVRDTPQIILADAARPVIDLFAAETGALLAMVRHLVGAELDRVSPLVTARIVREVSARIVTPYLDEHFWWMGRGDEPMNNWTAWCTQNVLVAVMTTVADAAIRRRVVDKAAASLDFFLKDYGDDGCCEEGVLYYRHAGLCLDAAAGILDAVTAGAFAPVWRQPKIRNIADYILAMHVAGRTYFNFADCSAVVPPCSSREFRFGRRVGSAALAAFAAADAEVVPPVDDVDGINLLYAVEDAFAAAEMAAVASGAPAAPAVPAGEIYYPSVGVFVARDGRFALAVKAGDNGDSHNHNDTGSVTLYKDGRPVLIDVGVESYTRKTFSPRRYEIWTMQSAWHNLPTFDGVMQEAGAAFAARDVTVAFEPDESRIALEIAGAYPPAAGLRSYRRRVRLIKGTAVEIVDDYDGDRPAELTLMLRDRPEIAAGLIRLPGLAEIRLDGAGLPRLETVPIADPRLRRAWPDTLYRVLVPLAGRRLTVTIA